MYRLIFPLSLSFLMFLIFSQQSFAASPWMRSGGELSYSGGLSYSTHDKSWDEDSDLRDSSCRSQTIRSNHRLEYGYSYYHTLIAGLGVVNKHCGDDDYTGIGNLRLGIRGRLKVFENGKTWEVTAIIPTGYSKNDSLRPGNGSFGIEAGVAYLSRTHERDFAKNWEFLAGASLRFWASGPADQFLTYAGVRRRFGKHARLSLRMNADISFRNEDSKQNSFGDETQLSDYDKVTLKLSWADRVNDDWRYKISASHVVWGRNAGHNMKVGVTFSRHWGP